MQTENGKKPTKRKLPLKIIFLVLIFFVIALRVFVGEVCSVPSASMSPTIHIGDWLWIDKLTYGAQLPRRFADIPIFNVFTWIKPLRLADAKNDWGYNRMAGFRMPRIGDMAVFESPEFPHPLLVKRIAAIFSEGDTIVVNAQNFDRMYPLVTNEGHSMILINDSIYINGQLDYLCIISQPYYYMLGDNSENSHDSRMFGFVPYSSLVGRMNFVIFSIDPDTHFFHSIRWNRFFKKIN